MEFVIRTLLLSEVVERTLRKPLKIHHFVFKAEAMSSRCVTELSRHYEFIHQDDKRNKLPGTCVIFHTLNIEY